MQQATLSISTIFLPKACYLKFQLYLALLFLEPNIISNDFQTSFDLFSNLNWCFCISAKPNLMNTFSLLSIFSYLDKAIYLWAYNLYHLLLSRFLLLKNVYHCVYASIFFGYICDCCYLKNLIEPIIKKQCSLVENTRTTISQGSYL